jgi:N-acylneuraminate cytidylyltransferase
MKIIALICARGSSQGIKNKNLLKFKSTTLLGNAIRQARKSKYISRVIISTDSHKVAKEAIKNKGEVPFIRPSKLAHSKSPEIQTWRHAVKCLNKYKDIDFLVSVPTTSPLRKTSDINKCIYKAIKEKLDIVFTVSKSLKNPYFNILRFNKRKLDIVCNNKKKIFRRQDAPQCYDLTTVCYVFRPNYIMKNKNIFRGKTGFVLIPKERAIDIDDKFDYKIANFLS